MEYEILHIGYEVGNFGDILYSLVSCFPVSIQLIH